MYSTIGPGPDGCSACGAPGWRQVVPTLPTSKSPPACTHCYCQHVDVGGTPHKMCCNCGNKQAMFGALTPGGGVGA